MDAVCSIFTILQCISCVVPGSWFTNSEALLTSTNTFRQQCCMISNICASLIHAFYYVFTSAVCTHLFSLVLFVLWCFLGVSKVTPSMPCSPEFWNSNILGVGQLVHKNIPQFKIMILLHATALLPTAALSYLALGCNFRGTMHDLQFSEALYHPSWSVHSCKLTCMGSYLLMNLLMWCMALRQLWPLLAHVYSNVTLNGNALGIYDHTITHISLSSTPQHPPWSICASHCVLRYRLIQSP